jgi:hypothetical protein
MSHYRKNRNRQKLTFYVGFELISVGQGGQWKLPLQLSSARGGPTEVTDQ